MHNTMNMVLSMVLLIKAKNTTYCGCSSYRKISYLPKNQISAAYRFIENIQIRRKLVHLRIFPVNVRYHNPSSTHACLISTNLQTQNPTSHLRNGDWCSTNGCPSRLRSLQVRHSGSIRLSMPVYLGGLSSLRSMLERLSLFLRRSFCKAFITTTPILKGFIS